MLLGAVLGVVSTAAQDCEVQPVEGGIYAGPTYPLGGYFGGDGNACFTMGFSVRYNLPDTPVDCGVSCSWIMSSENSQPFVRTVPYGQKAPRTTALSQ